MKKINVERSSKASDSGHSGSVLVENFVNLDTSLDEGLARDVPKPPRVSHGDVVKTSLGLLCMGTSVSEAAAGVIYHNGFKEALGLGRVPLEKTMPQRFERYAEVFAHHVGESSTERLEKTEIPVTALSTGHVTKDLNLFCLDHSGAQKAGVLRTDQGEDRDAPMGAYLGDEVWCLGTEFRDGQEHSEK